MARSNYKRVSWAWAVLLGVATTAAVGADEFVAPPKSEREVTAAVTQRGGRVQVDSDYRIVSVSLAGECGNDELKGLAACERLTQVSINSRNVTDAGLESLKSATKLTSISITTSGISTEGVDALRAALPNCRLSVLGRGPTGTTPAAGPGDRPTATRPGGGGPGGRTGGFGFQRRGPDLLRTVSIQDDLKLTPEQREQVSAARSAAALAAFQKAQDELALALLSPEQQARLRQLELQQLGTQGLLREDIVKQLEITADQQAAVRKLLDEAAAEMRTMTADAFRQRAENGTDFAKVQEQARALTKSRDEKILAALEEKQREAWKSLIGPPGPTVGSAFRSDSRGSGTSRQVPLTSAEAIKAIIALIDKDGDGSITDAEFPAGNRTREAITRAGIELTVPISRENLEQSYAKYLERSRERRE